MDHHEGNKIKMGCIGNTSSDADWFNKKPPYSVLFPPHYVLKTRFKVIGFTYQCLQN